MPQTAKERYEQIRSELENVCAEASRNPGDVKLIAVSKTVGVQDVAAAIAGGAHDFGENRPEGIMEKHDAFPGEQWHFIGNIQSRRISDIVGRATMIHSLYQLKHAQKINEVASSKGIVQDVLLEVNVSGEESKSGLSPNELFDMLAECENMDHLRVRGLMTMAPQGDLVRARETFAGLRELADAAREKLPDDKAAFFNELSMGMSEDWREAVFEGATMIRIGRAIFSSQFEA